MKVDLVNSKLEDFEGGYERNHKPMKHVGSELAERTSQETRSKESNKKLRKQRKSKINEKDTLNNE